MEQNDLKKCLRCEQEFNPRKAEFYCLTGEPHELPLKTYYMDDAPTDPGPYINGVATGDNRKHSRTLISNLVPEKIYVQGTERHVTPGRNVEFIRGVYSTTDAEEQFYLDRRMALKQGGLCTKERWEEVYLTDNQKNELRKMDLDARERRLEIDRNELLAMKKRETGPSAENEPENEPEYSEPAEQEAVSQPQPVAASPAKPKGGASAKKAPAAKPSRPAMVTA